MESFLRMLPCITPPIEVAAVGRQCHARCRLTHGSGELVRQLLAAGLVDELHLYIYPLVLGKGKRLFGDDAMPSEFDLVESSTTATGVIITRYRKGGEVKTGRFEE